MFYGHNLLLLRLNNRRAHTHTNTLTHKVTIHAVRIMHSHLFSCLCFGSCLCLRGFSGQEGEEAVDKDKYNYWESNHPQTHGFLSYLHLLCCIETAAPGHTSCTRADGKGSSNVAIKCNYRQTMERGKPFLKIVLASAYMNHGTESSYEGVWGLIMWVSSS